MATSEAARLLEAYAVADLCSAHPGVQAMHSSLTPLFLGARICGPARTARTPPGQNAAIHRAVASAQPGEVLVVGCRDATFGPFGDILAACCLARGIQGLVIDSTVRDTARIREMRFPVFCLGASPVATGKTDPGEINVGIQCGGVRVRPGDIVVGDDDGVVVVAREIAAEAAERARARVRWEKAVRRRIAQGESSCDILGIAVQAPRRP